MLGLPKGQVKLVPSHPQWKQSFNEESRILKTILGDLIEEIEHIGSTAINGIESKPIVDILIGVKTMDNVSQFDFDELKKEDYLRLKANVKDKVVIAKFSDLTNYVKTHIIHVVEINGDWWKQHIFFRDYLNANPEVAAEYDKLKTELARKYSNNEMDYTNGKLEFVNEILGIM